MTRSFEEAQQLWAAKQFERKGLPTQPYWTYEIENTIIYGGYCETCSYETVGFRIAAGGMSVDVEKDYSEMVREISEFANG